MESVRSHHTKLPLGFTDVQIERLFQTLGLDNPELRQRLLKHSHTPPAGSGSTYWIQSDSGTQPQSAFGANA